MKVLLEVENLQHNLAVIRHICDRVAVMYLGRIVELAPVEALFETPKHPYTEALLSAVPTLEAEARREEIVLEGDVPSPLRVPSGCRFHPRCHKRLGEICLHSVPTLCEAGDGHEVACHIHTPPAGVGPAGPVTHSA